MAATRTRYACSSCTAEFPQWYGRCPKCNEFATIDEVVAAHKAGTAT